MKLLLIYGARSKAVLILVLVLVSSNLSIIEDKERLILYFPIRYNIKYIL